MKTLDVENLVKTWVQNKIKPAFEKIIDVNQSEERYSIGDFVAHCLGNLDCMVVSLFDYDFVRQARQLLTGSQISANWIQILWLKEKV